MKRRTRAILLGLVAGFAVLAIVDQVVQHTVLSTGYFRGVRVAPFDPPLFSPMQEQRVADYRRIAERGADPSTSSDFDPELGWQPRPLMGHDFYWADARGARIGKAAVANERSVGVRRAIAVGCSFTFGQEVDGPETWPARVDESRQDLEVLNFGFGFYGLDQALLRYRRVAKSESAEEVWLGLLPSALLRIVGVYPPTQRHWTGVVHVKPRFVLDASGALELVPSPASSLGELVTLLSDQDRFLERVGARDAWVQRCPSAYEGSGTSAWHHSAFARLLVTRLERGEREARPHVLDAGSEVRRLALGIVRELDREVRANGARFRVVILPDQLDLVDRAERGTGYWQGLVDEITSAGIEVADLAPAFAAVGAQSDARYWAPEGHYSADGNRIAAEAVLEHLARAR